MSNLSIAPIRALFDTRMNQEDILLLGILCTYTDEDGYCFPGLETISKILSPIVGREKPFDVSTISKRMVRLAQFGYVVNKGQRKTAAGSYKSSQYKVIYDAVLPLEFDRRGNQTPFENPLGENQTPFDSSSVENQTNVPVLNVPKERKAAHAAPIPEAVKVYRSVKRAYPPRSAYADIDSAVGAKPKDLEFWRKVLCAQDAAGWNPRNVGLALEFFKKRKLPGKNGNKESVTQTLERWGVLGKQADDQGDPSKDALDVSNSARSGSG